MKSKSKKKKSKSKRIKQNNWNNKRKSHSFSTNKRQKESKRASRFKVDMQSKKDENMSIDIEENSFASPTVQTDRNMFLKRSLKSRQNVRFKRSNVTHSFNRFKTSEEILNPLNNNMQSPQYVKGQVRRRAFQSFSHGDKLKKEEFKFKNLAVQRYLAKNKNIKLNLDFNELYKAQKLSGILEDTIKKSKIHVKQQSKNFFGFNLKFIRNTRSKSSESKVLQDKIYTALLQDHKNKNQKIYEQIKKKFTRRDQADDILNYLKKRLYKYKEGDSMN